MSRLLFATRVTVAVTLCAIVMAPLAAMWHAPLTVVLFGAIVAMQASLAVTDAEPRLTTALVPLPGSVGLTLGAFFASSGLAADLAFLAVLFGAVAVRAYGPRWTAFGTIAMITYFFALFIHANVAQVPVLVVAIIVGTACSYLVRFVFLPDRAFWIARRTIEAYEARIRRVVVVASDLTRAPRNDRLRRNLRTAVRRLNETATSIESRFDTAASEEIRIVYDAELAAEDLASAALRARACDAPTPRAVRLALVALGRGRFERASRLAGSVRRDARLGAHGRALSSAVVDVCATIVRVKTTAAALARTDAPWVAASAQQPALRQAIQVTVAATVAIAAGEALSPQRWYWAVLATYFVFIGTASSGETLARAWSRIAGTGFGAIAGVLAGLLVKNDTGAATAALVGCIFFGAYVLRISHAMMIFFITASLALLYIVLGRFSDDLLVIRLAETAIGAVCGGIAATFILPTRTHAVVRDQFEIALDALRSLVRACIARLVDPRTAIEPLDAARTFEECVQRFVARAQPAVASQAFLGAGRELRRVGVVLQTCSYDGRTLARVVDRASETLGVEIIAVLAELEERIVANIARVVARVEDDEAGANGVDTASRFEELHRLTETGDGTSPLEIALPLLARIDGAVARTALPGTKRDVHNAKR